MYLDDFDFREELAVLRYNQCFTVVPESKRSLMENYQSWQPRIAVKKNEDSESNADLCQETVLNSKSSSIISNKIHLKSANHDMDFKLVQNSEDESSITPNQVESISMRKSKPIDLNVTECFNDYFEDKPPNEKTSLEYQEEIVEMIIENDNHFEEDYIIEEVVEELSPQKFNKLPNISKDQRKWVNETTKACHSIEQSADGAETPTWVCLICKKRHRSSQALRLHFISKHLAGESKLTAEVKEWLRNKNRERRKMIETENGNKFEWNCDTCNFTCHAAKTFRKHLIENHLKSEKQDNLGWEKCNLISKDLNDSQEHEIAASKLSRPRKVKILSQQWTCDICYFQFSAQRLFDAHIRVHETLNKVSPCIEIFWCEECRMFFRSVDDLTIHVDGHAEGLSVLVPAKGIALQKTILFKRLPIPEEHNEDSETCGHCGRKLVGESTCKSHLLIHHVNPIFCPKDDRQFTSMQPFICHLQKVHSELLPDSLRCTHCRVSFDNIYERLAHMNVCDQKKFSCDHCDKKFSNKNILNAHLKRVMGLLVCKCLICGKIARTKDDLKIHMRSHNKEKNFFCSICDKSYT